MTDFDTRVSLQQKRQKRQSLEIKTVGQEARSRKGGVSLLPPEGAKSRASLQGSESPFALALALATDTITSVRLSDSAACPISWHFLTFLLLFLLLFSFLYRFLSFTVTLPHAGSVHRKIFALAARLAP